MKLKLFSIMMVLILSLLAACGSDSSNDSDGEQASEGDAVQLKVFLPQPRFKEIYEDYFHRRFSFSV